MALDFGALQDGVDTAKIEQSITEATPGEVQGAAVGSTLDSLPAVRLAKEGSRIAEEGAAPVPFDGGLPDAGFGQATDLNGPLQIFGTRMGQPQNVIPAADAAKQAKDAGVDVKFDSPISQSRTDAIIADHVTEQKRAAVIARNGDNILSGKVGRFVTGSLLSLADPINVASMLIPFAPEAMVAEKLAAASGSFLARTGVRAVAGAVNGAGGMLALEPFNYLMDQREHNDWDAGSALRNLFIGAAAGGVLHAGFGALFGDAAHGPVKARDPEIDLTATRAAIAQVAEARPIDIAGIVNHGELSRMADDLERRQPGEAFDHVEPTRPTEAREEPARAAEAPAPATEAPRPVGDEAPSPAAPEVAPTPAEASIEGQAPAEALPAATPIQDRIVAALEPEARTRYDEIQAQIKDPATPPEARASHEGERQTMLEGAVPKVIADLRASADQAARDAVTRARNPAADPDITRGERIGKTTVDTAPKVEGGEKDLTELTKLVTDRHDELMAEIKAGRIVETQEMRDAMLAADQIENEGKAAADYAACLVGRGAV